MSHVYKYHYGITASRANSNAMMVKPDENHPVSKELLHAPSTELQEHRTRKQLLQSLCINSQPFLRGSLSREQHCE